MLTGATIAFILGTIGAYGAAQYGSQNYAKKLQDDNASYKDFQNTLETYGLSDWTLDEVITRLHDTGYMSDADYSEALKTVNSIYKVHNGTATVGEIMGYAYSGDSESKKVAELMNTLTDNIPNIKNFTYDDALDYINSLQQTGAGGRPGDSIGYAPAPNYLDTNFEGYQRDVEPTKIWSGPALAELHDINYDPNHYYDVIKQGTTAEVNRANYEADLLNEASLRDDTTNINNYLDALRNNKADAISTGATAGAQAAADILTNRSLTSGYADNQAQVAQNKFNAVDDALRADAQAKITARDYFNSLAQSLGNVSGALYLNDSKRWAQDILTNAELYAADQNLRGQRTYANASMGAAANTANSMIDAYKASANQSSDEFAWVFNNFLRANNAGAIGNTAKQNQDAVNRAVADMNGYLYAKYKNGYTNYTDYSNNVLSK